MNRKYSTRFFPESGTLKRNALVIKTKDGSSVRISVHKHQHYSRAVKLVVHTDDELEIIDEDILIIENNNKNFR